MPDSFLKFNNNNMGDGMQGAVATAASYMAGAVSAITGWSLNEWLAIAGLFFMALTYFTNLYFKRRDDRRREAEHALLMEEKKAIYSGRNI